MINTSLRCSPPLVARNRPLMCIIFWTDAVAVCLLLLVSGAGGIYASLLICRRNQMSRVLARRAPGAMASCRNLVARDVCVL